MFKKIFKNLKANKKNSSQSTKGENKASLKDVKSHIDRENYQAALDLLQKKSGEPTKTYFIYLYRILTRLDKIPEAIRCTLDYTSNFPSDEAGIKMLYASINKLKKKHKKLYFDYSLKLPATNLTKERDVIKLNVGAGDTYIPGFVGLDHYTGHFGSPKDKNQIEFDIRGDELPFENESVDAIYCSHVLEHIEDCWIKKFLSESSRVLKKNGVLRISSPNAKLCWENSFPGTSFWNHRSPWFKVRGIDPQMVDHIDCLIREICTPKLRHNEKPFNIRYSNLTEVYDYMLSKPSYEDAMNKLTSGAVYDEKFPGNHINFIDLRKLREFGDGLFSMAIESRAGGSSSNHFQVPLIDETATKYSLYIDFYK